MKKFFNNCKGAVTVFVTLLMIPAILVSGTAVDAARIYMTRNSVQNANQLAANASLASYNALLKDMYALFGFMSDDPELAAMMNEYIQITIYGKDPDKGTFRSFLGSDDYTANLEFTGTLRDPGVLKQQILEYMKFRGPAIIIQRIFDSLDSGAVDRIEQDSDILDLKEEIDNTLEDILEKYDDLYYAIMQADSCRTNQGENPRSLNGRYVSISDILNDSIIPDLNEIRECFAIMEDARVRIKTALIPKDRDDILDMYSLTLGIIRNRAQRIESNISQMKINAENFRQYFRRVVEIANDIDSKSESLQIKLADLKGKLDRDECSPGVKAAFTQPPPSDPFGKPLIERYDELLETVISPMARRYRDEGYKYIDDIVLPALEEPDFIRYRDYKKEVAGEVTEDNSLTLDQLKSLSSDPDFGIYSTTNRAAYFAGLTDLSPDDPDYVDFQDLRHFLPGPFYRFGNRSHFGDEQADFWELLESMITGGGSQFIDMTTGTTSTGSGGSKKEQKKQIDAIKNRDSGDTDVPSSGAQRIDDPDWVRTNDNLSITSLAKNVIKLFSNPKGIFRDSQDFALILTYDMSMFSHYTTSKPNGGTDYSITGVPKSPKVNYYYQSEWEYLLVGQKNASDNLKDIKDLIYKIRLIVNFIAIWNITQINNVITLIRALPIPFGIPFVLGELARLAFLFAETSLDVSRLRKGYKVALFKDDSTWLCQPPFTNVARKDDDSGFTYEDYLTVFFVAKALASSPSKQADVLAARTADLIEWNCVNYQFDVRANEGKMKDALKEADRFRMSNAATTVTIETTVDMRMLFLSMPFAQKGIDGVIPPKTLPITMSDVRGY